MKEIEIKSGKLNVWLASGGMSVTAEALPLLKQIGQAYGIYSLESERARCRIMVAEEPERALVLQEDTGYHGRPEWETTRVITTDPKRIDAYTEFCKLVKICQELDRDESERTMEKKPPLNRAAKRRGLDER